MEQINREFLTEDEKTYFINALTKNLTSLRAKAGMSQEEISNIIGVSRQTYGAMERKHRTMSWNTYLSLILFYDYNKKTHDMIRGIDAFPHELIKRFNGDEHLTEADFGLFFSDDVNDILVSLDEQAIKTLKTVMIVEYARCKNLSNDSTLKLFEGLNFTINKNFEEQALAAKALKALRRKKRKNG